MIVGEDGVVDELDRRLALGCAEQATHARRAKRRRVDKFANVLSGDVTEFCDERFGHLIRWWPGHFPRSRRSPSLEVPAGVAASEPQPHSDSVLREEAVVRVEVARFELERLLLEHRQPRNAELARNDGFTRNLVLPLDLDGLDSLIHHRNSVVRPADVSTLNEYRDDQLPRERETKAVIMLQGFKSFVMRGNVMDLAVAVVIGAAFNTVIERVVESVVNPVIGMFFRADSLDTALMIALPGGGTLALGAVIGAIINFLIVALVVYLVFVLPMNRLRERRGQSEEEAPPSEQELLTEIRDLLREQTK